jgi:hypothetical protein
MKRSRCRSTPRCRPCGRWDPRSGSPSSPPAIPVGLRGRRRSRRRSRGNRNNARVAPAGPLSTHGPAGKGKELVKSSR